MAKTLAQLKRDAKAGILYGEMIIRNGNTEIPDHLKGKRPIVGANSVGIFFLNNNGRRSGLDIPCASLVEYTDDYLTIYNPGLRDLTPDEQAVFDEWESMRDHRQEEIDMLTDGSTTYWRRKYFFIDKGYEYLLGYEFKKGKKIDFNTGKVYDKRNKGSVCMKYKLYRKEDIAS